MKLSQEEISVLQGVLSRAMAGENKPLPKPKESKKAREQRYRDMFPVAKKD